MNAEVLASRMKTYDHSLEYQCDIYDHLPYVRNYEYCNEETIAITSGSIIKYYQCNIQKPVLISNQDDRFQEIVMMHQAPYDEDIEEIEDETEAESMDAISDEQFEALSADTLDTIEDFQAANDGDTTDDTNEEEVSEKETWE